MTADTTHEVPAEIFSDDRVYTVRFDVSAWLDQASDEDILALVACDWGGDYAADELAYWAETRDERVAQVLEYCRLRTASREPVGFEVHVDEQAAREYLECRRRYLLDLIDNGVTDEEGYCQLVDRRWQEAKERLRQLGFSEELTQEAAKLGLVVDGPEDISTDSIYRWHWFLIKGDRRYSAQFSLHPSLEYEETYAGLNFSFQVTSPGGRLLGDWAPYNYTPLCWVSAADEKACQRRLEELLDIVTPELLVRAVEEDDARSDNG